MSVGVCTRGEEKECRRRGGEDTRGKKEWRENRGRKTRQRRVDGADKG